MGLYQTTLQARYPNLHQLPGPKPRFPLGNLLDMRAQPLWQLSADLRQNHGPFALLWLVNQPLVFVHDPLAIGEILGAKSAAFYKHEPVAAMNPALRAVTTFTANGAEWQQMRRASFLSRPDFGTWLADSFEPSRTFLQTELQKRLPVHGKLDAFLFRLVFDLTSQMTLGSVLSDEAFSAYNDMMDVINLRISTNLPVLPPTFARRKALWFQAVEAAVEQARLEPDGTSMAHHFARHSRQSRVEQVNMMANVFPGGVWSVTAALTELLTNLHQHPEIQQPLRTELAKLSQDPQTQYANLQYLELLEQSLRETMRISPPVPAFMRRVKADSVQVGGVTLDRGVRVAIGVFPLHHDPQHWPKPGEFLPERWTPEVMAQNPYGSDYFFPFGRGERACHGGEMALFQLRVLTLALLGNPARTVQPEPAKAQTYYFGVRMPKGVDGQIA